MSLCQPCPLPSCCFSCSFQQFERRVTFPRPAVCPLIVPVTLLSARCCSVSSTSQHISDHSSACCVKYSWVTHCMVSFVPGRLTGPAPSSCPWNPVFAHISSSLKFLSSLATAWFPIPVLYYQSLWFPYSSQL